MRSDEFEAFSEVIGDLCAAFDRTPTDARNRTFWEVLKGFHLHDIRRSAMKWKNTQRKMPSPVELRPERAAAPPPKPAEDSGTPMSTWAMAANKILFSVAYQGHRGYRPMGNAVLKHCLAVKADYVQMAEQAESGGERWETQEFNRMCREGFEKLLPTTADQADSQSAASHANGDRPSSLSP